MAGRPKLKNKKVNVTIKVCPLELAEAKIKKINISKVSREAIKNKIQSVPYPDGC